MKRLLLATLCLFTVVTQADTTCKTDAVGITRCKDSNGVETRYRVDPHGKIRDSQGNVWRQDPHGKWRNDKTGTVISTDANGIIRSNKDNNTYRLDQHGSLRGSDGSICKKGPHGEIRCTD